MSHSVRSARGQRRVPTSVIPCRRCHEQGGGLEQAVLGVLPMHVQQVATHTQPHLLRRHGLQRVEMGWGGAQARRRSDHLRPHVGGAEERAPGLAGDGSKRNTRAVGIAAVLPPCLRLPHVAGQQSQGPQEAIKLAAAEHAGHNRCGECGVSRQAGGDVACAVLSLHVGGAPRLCLLPGQQNAQQGQEQTLLGRLACP